MIYLDNHATTPCDPAVISAMLPYFSQEFGNPSSSHFFGQVAAAAVRNAQGQISILLNVLPEEIIFTSGATESNNLALMGITQTYKANGGSRRKLITTKIEHKSVLAPLEQLQKEGWEICFLPLDHFGQVDLDKAQEIINTDTFLISVQLANSEIGTIQPVSSIVELAKNNGVIVHSDASQAVGKIPIDIQELGIDLLSLSGHKTYAPKGIGALWVNSMYRHELTPLMHGGSNFDHVRPGTLPVPLIVGLGKACEILSERLIPENLITSQLRDSFEIILLNKLPNLQVNGPSRNRLPNNSNITFHNVDSEALLANIPDIVASTGSACESGSVEPSRVLLEIGLSREEAFSSLRFGFGRFTTKSEVAVATTEIITACERLQTLD